MAGDEVKVVKRGGQEVPFNSLKIRDAIFKALSAVRNPDKELALILSKDVAASVKKSRKEKIHVEAIQDIVERILIKHNLPDAAKAYIIYRHKREQLRNAKQLFGSDELKLSVNAMKVLSARYLLKDESGKIIETPSQMLRRVARVVDTDKKFEDDFYRMMAERDFIPNTPTLMNAGTKLGQMSACFVLPVEDSLESIFEAVKTMALIQQSGGGTGFSFSKLRPRGDAVKSTRGAASGPVSFMRIFNETTEVIKQGGKRRGASMGILDVSHPDILDFISCKTKEGFLSNFNISAAVSDRFMHAVEKGYDFDFINPRTKEKVSSGKARDIFDLIAAMAWRTGEPGIIFIDRINRHNPVPELGKIESTNPCGEQPLLPYESCNLGSVNLSNFAVSREINWVKLKKTVRLAVRFLDNVIDANKYVLPEIRKMTKASRKIGLGVMGFAEMLIKLGIPYDSEEGLNVAGRVMAFIQKEARKASEEIGAEKGSFPAFRKSRLADEHKAMRNATVTTIAPTGTISIIADCTSGIEPLFAVAFVRNVLEGAKLVEINSEFENIAREKGFYSDDLIKKITETGSVQHLKEVPDDVKKIFRTALDISPEWHVKMQAAFQKHVDNAVSKTVNLPNDSSVDDVKKAYLLAYKSGCKGITVYRYGSRKEQVLYSGAALTKDIGEEQQVTAQSEFSGGCPTGYCNY